MKIWHFNLYVYLFEIQDEEKEVIEIQGIKICILLHWYSSTHFFLPLEVSKRQIYLKI